MATFRYRARDSGGALVEGLLEGADAESVASQLAATGVVPVEIRAAGGAAGGGAAITLRFLRRRPDITELMLFARQMYTMMRAGIPLNRAMAGLIRSTRNEVLAETLREVENDIESGRELSTALSRHGRIFAPLFVAMVRIGENTGRLDDAFLQIAEYLERDKDTRARIKAALRYPALVVAAIAIAIAIINVVVIPQFAAVFERAGADLPIYTRILVATSDFFVAWWPYLLAVAAGAAVGFYYWVRTDRGRLAWDRFKLRIPIIGDIVHRATLGRFARAFAMSLRAGVPLVQALAVTARAVGNEHIAANIVAMRTGIERGETITRTATASGMFTPIVLQMLGVGEETGAVDEMMDEVAGFYEREVDYEVKNLSAAIEPILIVFVAGLVLILALGVFLPMWDLASVKMGG